MTVMAAAQSEPLVLTKPALVSLAEAAKELGVTPRFLVALEVRGLLKIIRLGRKALVPRSEIDRLIRDGAPLPERDEA